MYTSRFRGIESIPSTRPLVTTISVALGAQTKTLVRLNDESVNCCEIGQEAFDVLTDAWSSRTEHRLRETYNQQSLNLV